MALDIPVAYSKAIDMVMANGSAIKALSKQVTARRR